MAITEGMRSQLGCRFSALLPHLNERQRRLAVAAEARLLGHGGVRAAAEAAKMSETTVRRGVAELESGVGPLPDGRTRAAGGGRKQAETVAPGLVNALMALIEPEDASGAQGSAAIDTRMKRSLQESAVTDKRMELS